MNTYVWLYIYICMYVFLLLLSIMHYYSYCFHFCFIFKYWLSIYVWYSFLNISIFVYKRTFLGLYIKPNYNYIPLYYTTVWLKKNALHPWPHGGTFLDVDDPSSPEGPRVSERSSGSPIWETHHFLELLMNVNGNDMGYYMTITPMIL